MGIDLKVSDIVSKACDSGQLSKDEIITLLRVPHHSVEAGYVMASADALNREVSGGKAEVHAQIGLNLSPCPNNCSFCAFAAKNKVFTEPSELSIGDVVQMAKRAEQDGANALFVMATGDYPMSKFIAMSAFIKETLHSDIAMIANVGDFGVEHAKGLCEDFSAFIAHYWKAHDLNSIIF